MTNYQLAILRAIADNQPVMISDLHKDSDLTYNTFSNMLTSMRDEGLIHKRGYKGPVWLTVKGRDKVDEA
jgi:DNA-binding MarR family transcriptional regulator